MVRIRPTHPPSALAAAGYRRAGFWQPALTAAQHWSQLAAGAERIALADHESQWTYAELVAAVADVAGALRLAGVQADDAVLVIAPLRNAAVAAYLAAVLHGAVVVLLDRRCGQADVANALSAAGPRAALAFDNDAQRLGLGQSCRVLPLDGIGGGRAGVTASVDSGRLLDPDVPALVVFTSGTTSTPKGVIHTTNSLRCGAANMTAALQFGGDDAFFLSSPLASITGVLQLETALAAHARVILDDRFSPPSSLERLNRHGATVLGGAPVIAQELFKEADRQQLDTLPLRCIAVGGSMIPQSVLDGAHRFGITPVRMYGSSEAPVSTATSVGADPGLSDDGAPLPGVEISLRDAGAASELLVRGPHQFHGYLDPADNAEAFLDGWVRTGDQADILDGRVTITGRLKDIAVRKGMKISLVEIDLAATGLGDCAAYTVLDDATGERVALALCAQANGTVTYEGVVDHLSAAGLAKWKVPEQIVVWKSPLPRTETGKILRQGLADSDGALRTIFAPRLEHTVPHRQDKELR